jgi:hypothetical protein
MPKAIKGNAGRKPPEPSADHSDIDNWCRRLMPDLQPIVKRLDESIRATVPGLEYAVKWKRAYYGLPGLGWIVEIAAYDVSVNVVFLGGADFELPPPLGTTDRTRYFKVTSLEEGHPVRTVKTRRRSGFRPLAELLAPLPQAMAPPELSGRFTVPRGSTSDRK